MKKLKTPVCLLLALVMCLTLTACGGSGKTSAPAATSAPEATATPEDVYVSEYKTLSKDSKNYFSVRSFSPDGMYCTSWEKIGENIPEGVKPQYEGQYDIYATFIYFMDKDGKLTRLENYQPIPTPENDKGYKEFSSGSDISGICFTPDGFVTIELAYSSWNDGDGNYAMYTEEYYQHQKFNQQYYIRSFDLEGNELSCATIDVPADGWLEAYRMQLDDKGNAVVSTGSGLRAIGLDGQDAYDININGYVNSLVTLADGRIAVSVSGDTDMLISI